MSYRGTKMSKQTRSLEKRNLVEERAISGIHNRGRGGKYRCLKRRKLKKVLQKEAEYKRTVEERIRKAEALLEEAKIYARFCPEEARRLARRAASLDRTRRSAVKSDAVSAASSSRTASAYAAGSRAKSWYSFWEPPVREKDPQVAAIEEAIRSGERNFMDGVSYRVNPVDTMKMITASSVFGEPQYYRSGEPAKARILEGKYGVDETFAEYSLRMLDPYKGMNTSQVMVKAIDDALTADFGETLKWAAELRERYGMRLNPQIIMVRAAIHHCRTTYTNAHPYEYGKIAQRVMSRGDDVINQVQYWLEMKRSKNGIPSLLKRAWAQNVSDMDAYTMAKYCHTGIGLVDVVRICHAKGPLVDILMQKGKVPMPEGQDTWERLRASGKSWQEIVSEIRMPHMALLRNLRGIFTEVQDPETREEVLALLKRGVRKGKQFPFRYLSAWKAVKAERRSWAGQVQDALEDCMGIACENLPVLKGRSAFLTDNSGSAWGACTSEWGTMKVADIGNLSSVIGAMCSEEGVVFPFGDRLESVKVRKDEGILKQAHHVGAIGKGCGGGTENGIWLFFRDAIVQRQHWDNIFVYSDMQAGHGGLYGIYSEDYAAIGARIWGRYIDVNMLVKLYRELVNPKVNVFCIQTAGYNNILVPEYGYRTAVLYGWTGKELLFADAMNRIWDELEAREPEKQ